MEELELLKKDWNKESKEFKNYSEEDIYKMIKHKSVSVTRVLCLIGSIEIILWALFGYIDEQFPIIRMGLFAVFFALIIYFYFKMKAEENSISLMKNILKVRKVIMVYTGISLLLIIIDNILHFDFYTKDFMAGIHDGRASCKLHTTNPEQMAPELGNYIIFGISLLILTYFLFRIYKSTYGKILFNLKKNYKELSKVEEN